MVTNPFNKGPLVKWPHRVEYRFLGFWPCGTLVGPRYLKESGTVVDSPLRNSSHCTYAPGGQRMTIEEARANYPKSRPHSACKRCGAVVREEHLFGHYFAGVGCSAWAPERPPDGQEPPQ